MRRGRILLAVAVSGGIAAAMWMLRSPAKSPGPPSATAFRAYLADASARMVAYSPEPEVARDPRRTAMRRQLALLREKFDGLSLYECTPETPGIVEAARSLGFKAVLLTVWDPRSESELATASSIARDNFADIQASAGGMALAISIGSEGLMEKRYTLADMQSARGELLDRASGTAVEMTTTEPWWLYEKPESDGLRQFGEFTSANIHVVWDTDLVDPALAASWTRDRALELRKTLGRPLLIREAGLPGGGSSPRETMQLHFTREMQADFWRTWLALDDRPPVAVFEGIDNPDKHWREFESSWGLLSTTLQPWPVWGVFPPLPAGRR